MYCSRLPTLTTRLAPTAASSLTFVPARNASKKASGGTRNPASGKGQSRGLKVRDGWDVIATNVLATQIRPFWLPGLNVGLLQKGFEMQLYALKSGKIIMTSECPDLNPDMELNQKLFGEMVGQTFFKKYIHVIPHAQHVRFKLIGQV